MSHGGGISAILSRVGCALKHETVLEAKVIKNNAGFVASLGTISSPSNFQYCNHVDSIIG